MTGSILVNGRPKEQSSFARVAGYMQQEAHHCARATVAEALLFSARLRVPADSQQRVAALVNEVGSLPRLCV